MSAQNQTTAIRIPTPVGGTPMHIDAVPSIIFAVAYACLIPFMLHKLLFRSQRLFMNIGTYAFTIERVVVYSLRAAQAFIPSKRLSGGLLIYLQLSFAQGFIAIAQDCVPLLRVISVQATNPPDVIEKRKEYFDPESVPEPREDRARERNAARRRTDLLNLVWLAATIPNGVQGGQYSNALKSQSAGDSVQRFRYASAGVSLLFIIVTVVYVVWSYFKVQGIKRRACVMLLVILATVIPIPIYRMVVMQYYIPDLLATGPGSQQSTGAKAAFYIFQSTLEWIGAALIVVPNTRKMFQTGPAGDWRGKDGEKSCGRRLKERKERKATEKANGADKATAADKAPATA